MIFLTPLFLEDCAWYAFFQWFTMHLCSNDVYDFSTLMMLTSGCFLLPCRMFWPRSPFGHLIVTMLPQTVKAIVAEHGRLGQWKSAFLLKNDDGVVDLSQAIGADATPFLVFLISLACIPWGQHIASIHVYTMAKPPPNKFWMTWLSPLLTAPWILIATKQPTCLLSPPIPYAVPSAGCRHPTWKDNS